MQIKIIQIEEEKKVPNRSFNIIDWQWKNNYPATNIGAERP